MIQDSGSSARVRDPQRSGARSLEAASIFVWQQWHERKCASFPSWTYVLVVGWENVRGCQLWAAAAAATAATAASASTHQVKHVHETEPLRLVDEAGGAERKAEDDVAEEGSGRMGGAVTCCEGNRGCFLVGASSSSSPCTKNGRTPVAGRSRAPPPLLPAPPRGELTALLPVPCRRTGSAFTSPPPPEPRGLWVAAPCRILSMMEVTATS